MSIRVKTQEEIEIIREGGHILDSILEELIAISKPGIVTAQLNKVAEGLIFKSGSKPSFRGYGGYPATLCVSINETVVHGLPSSRALIEGDIVGLDLGMVYNGFYTDAARTVGIGKISPQAKKLISVTSEILDLAIDNVKPGKHWGDIGCQIQNRAERDGFGVVRDLVGHGVGYAVHEDPWLPNYCEPGRGSMLKVGMVLAVEPMITAGDWRIELEKDGWGYKTKDGKLAAHFEDTIVVTPEGCEILTRNY